MARGWWGTGVLFGVALGIAACGGSGDGGGSTPAAPPVPPPPPPAPVVARVVVTPPSATLEVGKTVIFTAQAFDAADMPVQSSFTWESSDTAKATIDAAGMAHGLAPGPVDITAIAGAVRSTAASLAVTAPTGGPGPSSFEKIEEALRTGALDEQTAIVYKMFATFRDARLPAAYQGDDSAQVESDVFDLVYSRWSILSDQAKETLEPFLVPPAYTGSWAAPTSTVNAAHVRPQSLGLPICRQPTIDPNWAAKPATQNGRVKVWYDTRVAGANTKADMLVTEFETRIWPTLVDTVGMKAPLSDGALEGCNGGDGRLDVYLVDMATQGQTATDLGETLPVQPATKQKPAFILLNRALSDDELKASAAHEFMHASQWAYPVAATFLSSYGWLKEATAQWAIDGVYGSTLQIEQRKAPMYMESPDLSLETDERGPHRTYGSYLFFQFLARTVRPQLIADAWNGTLAQTEQTKAVDTAIPGGFKEQWPKFAKALWNQDPVNTNSFEGWDGLTLTPAVRGGSILNINLNGQGGAVQKFNGNVKHLASHYYHLRVNDTNVRSLAFYNHFWAVTGIPDSHVTTQVFIKKQNSIWEYEHWSDEGIKEANKTFCLDLVAERIDEIVIVMSNGHPTNDVTDMDVSAPRISVSNVGCWRYKGTASITENRSGGAGSFTYSADGSATLERWRPPEMPEGAPGSEIFVVSSGAVTGHSVSIDPAGCTTTRDTNGQIAAGLLSGTNVQVKLGLDLGDDLAMRDVGGVGLATVRTHTELKCGDQPPIIIDADGAWEWLGLPIATEMKVEVKPDGTIQGSYTRQIPAPIGGTRTMIWNFAPQRQ